MRRGWFNAWTHPPYRGAPKNLTAATKGDERMDTPKLYVVPKLAYDYKALAPIISEDLLRLHHDKHHTAYVNGANTILQKMDKARTDNVDFDTKATFKELSFHIGGHLLHSLFWANLAPSGNGGGEKPSKTIGKAMTRSTALSSGSKSYSRKPQLAPRARVGQRSRSAGRRTGPSSCRSRSTTRTSIPCSGF